jgi:hypothetical protein
MTALFESRTHFVFEEAGLTEAIGQKLRCIADLAGPCQSCELRMQVEARSHAVEEQQAPDQGRGNDQNSIGILKTVANQEPWLAAYVRGHEIQVKSKLRKDHHAAPVFCALSACQGVL